MLKVYSKMAAVIVILLMLTACASTVIDETIPISENFAANSELVTFNESGWKVGSKQYKQKLRNYSVDNTKVHWEKSRQQFKNSERESNFINYLLFDDDYSFIKEKFDVDNTQKYSFDLIQNEQLIANSKCEIFSHSMKEKILSKDDYDSEYYEDAVINKRLETYVLCAIRHKDQLWELSLFAADDELLDVQLETDGMTYTGKGVSELILLQEGENGIEKVQAPRWSSEHSGLELYDVKNKISALSFVGKPKIWLQVDLSDNLKELLLTVNYSLWMFDHLDEEWRTNYP